jgi:hypothetical protein
MDAAARPDPICSTRSGPSAPPRRPGSGARRRPRRRLAPLGPAVGLALLALAGLRAPAARGQTLAGPDLARLFPAPPGETVLGRARPLYDPVAVRLGLLAVRPRLDLGLGYDSDPTGLPGGRGGFVLRTAPSLALGAGWGRDRIGVYLGLDDRRVRAVPAADRTDWTAAAGLRLGFGPDLLRLTAALRQRHEDGSQVGALPTDRPLPYRVLALRAAWRIGAGTLSVTPAIGLAAWRYGAASLAGLPVSQRSRDRDVLQGGLTGRYTLWPRTDAVLVLRGTGSRYVSPGGGMPGGGAPGGGAASRNSTGIAVLAGVEGGDRMLHLRLLLGWERRMFVAAAYGSHAAPIAEMQAVWQPSGMTTVTATLSRRIEDAAQEGVAGFTETAAGLRIDREAWRNLLLSVAAGVQQARFTNGGGSETGTRFGASATWLLNRHLRLTAAETVSAVHGQPAAGAPGSGATTRSVSLLTLGFAP